MSTGPDAIIDAGPALTFLARKDTTRILYAGLGKVDLLAPEQVELEVIRKSRKEKQRFGAAEAAWKKIADANRLTVLPDDETAELAAAVQRLCRMPMSERMRQQQDLGELLVIAHAAVRAEAGGDVAVLIQERDGTAMSSPDRRMGTPIRSCVHDAWQADKTALTSRDARPSSRVGASRGSVLPRCA